MHDFITLGTTPYDELCACVGEENYHDRALQECNRYMKLLRKIFGLEPLGARFGVKWFDHDFGAYVEVVCYYNTELPASMDYAFRCENELPATWEG